MLPMLEVSLADGRELDIPAGSVIMFEEMNKDTNPNFPSARSFIHYAMGDDLRQAVLSTSVEDLIFELGINTQKAGRWLRLTNKDTSLRVVLLSSNVVARMALEEGCELSYMLGNDVKTVQVNESRREIKKWTQKAETGRPEGLMEMPVPEENRIG